MVGQKGWVTKNAVCRASVVGVGTIPRATCGCRTATTRATRTRTGTTITASGPPGLLYRLATIKRIVCLVESEIDEDI